MTSRLAKDIEYAAKLIESRQNIYGLRTFISVLYENKTISVTYINLMKRVSSYKEAVADVNKQIEVLKVENKSIKVNTSIIGKDRMIVFPNGNKYVFTFDDIDNLISTTEYNVYPDTREGILLATFKLLTFLSRTPEYYGKTYLLYDDIKKYVNTNIARIIMEFYK